MHAWGGAELVRKNYGTAQSIEPVLLPLVIDDRDNRKLVRELLIISVANKGSYRA